MQSLAAVETPVLVDEFIHSWTRTPFPSAFLFSTVLDPSPPVSLSKPADIFRNLSYSYFSTPLLLPRAWLSRRIRFAFVEFVLLDTTVFHLLVGLGTVGGVIPQLFNLDSPPAGNVFLRCFRSFSSIYSTVGEVLIITTGANHLFFFSFFLFYLRPFPPPFTSVSLFPLILPNSRFFDSLPEGRANASHVPFPLPSFSRKFHRCLLPQRVSVRLYYNPVSTTLALRSFLVDCGVHFRRKSPSIPILLFCLYFILFMIEIPPADRLQAPEALLLFLCLRMVSLLFWFFFSAPSGLCGS